jgi:hypothetical protein
MTETVSLDGRKESFSLARLAINIPDPKIDILDPTVDVRVEIAERKRDGIKLGLGPAEGSPYVAKIITPAKRQ